MCVANEYAKFCCGFSLHFFLFCFGSARRAADNSDLDSRIRRPGGDAKRPSITGQLSFINTSKQNRSKQSVGRRPYFFVNVSCVVFTAP